MASRLELERQAEEILRSDTGGPAYLGYVKFSKPSGQAPKGARRAQYQEAQDRATAIYRAMPKEDRRKLSERYKADRERGVIHAKSWAQWLLLELGKIHGLSLQ